MSPHFAWVHSSTNQRKRISCSCHSPEYDDIWFCFSIVLIRLQNLSHIPPLFHIESLIFFQLFAKYRLILFCRDFILKQFLFSSKSELRFNQLVVLPLGNRFLFTEDISRSIRIQHIELEHYMYFTYEHIHSFYTIPQCGQGGSWSALYPPIKNTKIYVCFTGMWVGFC